MGVPHRFPHVARCLDLLLERNDVTFMTGSEITDWFVATQRPGFPENLSAELRIARYADWVASFAERVAGGQHRKRITVISPQAYRHRPSPRTR